MVFTNIGNINAHVNIEGDYFGETVNFRRLRIYLLNFLLFLFTA
jgi:hypothetical protein